jgi:hypothetical protein
VPRDCGHAPCAGFRVTSTVVRRSVVFSWLLAAAVSTGCGGSSVFESFELWVSARGWYRLSAVVTGCLLEQTRGTSYSLDGEVLPPDDVCGASSGPLMEDRAYAIGVRKGYDRGEVIVADMFPGMHATVIEPPGGVVASGGDIVVSIPEATRAGFPTRALFSYTDGDDPGYDGETVQLVATSPDTVIVPAPAHPGHFTLEIAMELHNTSVYPLGRILSCHGVAQCEARAAIDLGPLAIEVAAK